MNYLRYTSKAIVFTLSTLAVSAYAATDSLTTCTGPGGDDVRTIEVVHESVAGLPCATVYTKHEMANEIARANATQGYCDSVSSKVVANLESANFECVSDAQVETTGEEVAALSDEIETENQAQTMAEEMIDAAHREVEAE